MALRTNGRWGKPHTVFPVCPLHLMWVSLLAPLMEASPLDPLPAYRCVSLISLNLSLIHPFPGSVSASLSHTYTHTRCTDLGLHPSHASRETLWHTFPWVSMILFLSPSPHPPSPPSVGKSEVLVLTAVVRVLGLLVTEPNEQHRIFLSGML